MSSFGVVSTLNAPVLKDVTQPDLIKFDIEYTAYKEKVNDLNRTRDASRQIVPATIRQCLDPVLLQSLCLLRQIEGASNAGQSTDTSVKAWFDTRLETAPEDLTERVRSALETVKYEVNKQDPSGAALSFIVKIVSALDKNNASEVIDDKETCKSLIWKLVQKLEPPELRERIRSARDCWTGEQKSSLSFFQTRVSAIAVEVAQGEIARGRLNKRTPRKGKRVFDAEGTEKYSGPRRKQKTTPNPRQNYPKARASDKSRSTWDKPCLNPDCDGIHRVMECPNSSEERKKELLDEYRAGKRKPSPARFKSVRAQGEDHTDEEEGRYKVMIEDSVPFVALGDYGSDESALSLVQFEKLIAAVPDLQYEALPEKVSLCPAIRGSHENPITFTASRRVKLSVTIMLPNTNLPIRIHHIPFLVVDQAMDEVLLGRPLLKKMGFNLKSHLENVGQTLHGKSFDELDGSEVKIARAAYNGMRYNSVDDDPIDLPEAAGANIGVDKKEDIDKAFNRMLKEAKENGMSEKGCAMLSTSLNRYRKVFRIQLGPDPPAKVTPLTILPKANAAPFRSPQRRYAPPQTAFIASTIRKLEKVGAVFKNPTARWASPALAVPKPGSEGFRFTVDLRGPNSQTEPIVSAMPHLESQLQTVQGSTCFAKVDMAHAYWQIPIATESQEMMSIQTPLGVYSSTRLLQGSTDAGNHYQAVTHSAFQEKVKRFLQWLDDFLLHAISEEELLDVLEAFFAVCEKYGFKIHAEKSQLFLKEAKFCGRTISASGVRFDPRQLDALIQMRTPTLGGDLQQFLCATNWMRTSIPSYANIVAPLHELMESVYQQAGGRTKRKVSKIPLASLWGAEHDSAFAIIKQRLARSTELAHPKQNSCLCLFTDASETHWSAILTQVSREDIKKEVEKQDHEPLSFLSGAFTGPARSWSVPEKEAFPVVEAMCRLDYIIMGRTVAIFTDHANLVYLFDPYGQNPGMARHTACKLMRWAVKLSAFRYVIEHLAGERNVWADMLTRWAVQGKSTVRVARFRRLKSLMLAPVSPHLDPKLDWPRPEDIKKSQRKHKESARKSFSEQNEILVNENGVVWIPEEDQLLQLRILIAAHTGLGGHRGWRTTLTTVKAHFWWTSITKDVETFVRSCLHCLATETGETVPRPLGHALHAGKPNEMIHFDYCYISKGEDEFCYVLVIKDDFSGYVWLVPTTEADAVSTANALLSWFASFGTVVQWVSDRGTHFKNEVVRALREQTNGSHHFTLAYCPWSNGTVEVVCRELLRAMRALLSEFQLPQRSWPSVVPLVQSVLNNSPLTRLGNRCPLNVFTGLPQNNPLLSVKSSVQNKILIKTIEEIRAKQLMTIEDLHSALDDMHRDVVRTTSKKREDEVRRHNNRTNVRPINFTEGDYVLRGVYRKDRGRKPSVRWRGPYRVTACLTEYIFEVEDLLTGARSEVHGRRLKFFRNKDFEITEEVRNQLAYQENELLVVKEFQDIKVRDGTVQLLTSWKGFDETENDWVSLELMQEDVPTLVKEFLEEIRKAGTRRQQRVAASV